MSNQSPAQEPTMEEILASIRRIISEDSGGKDEPDVAEAPPPADDEPDEEFAEFEELPGPAVAALPDNQTLIEEDIVFEEDEVLELTDPLVDLAPEPEPQPEPIAAAEAPPAPPPAYEPARYEPEEDIAFEEPSMSAQPTHGSSPATAAPSASGLLSSDAATATSAAFGALTSTLLTSSGESSRTLEDLVSDMLRPMLKQWLDHNLPPLVEQLVREEIERVARRPR